jgi:Zn-dependent protease/CBS domain-containing protein
MRGGGLSLGRIFGIEIRIDWSWLLIFVLVTWNLASLFGQTHSNWSTSQSLLLAVVAAILFFGSVLAHELAHSLVAQTRGVPVRSITLFLFGGVSNIQRDPDSPAAEFLITIVGPIMSLVIGVVLLLAAGIGFGTTSQAISDPTAIIKQAGPLTTMALWLGSVNLMLGVFNLIPGFPLDGGRVLRSILWAATGSVRKATRWASYVGQAIAWAFIVIGVSMIFGVSIPFFGQGFINGLWLAFIGWFLNTASAQSYQSVVIQDVLAHVPVERMMRTDPPTVPPDITVSTLVHDHLMGSDEQSFPVMAADGAMRGIVTLDDVRRLPHERWDDTRVMDIMTPASELMTVPADEDAADAFNKLMERDVRQLPVMRDGKLAGMFRRRDVVRWLQIHSNTQTGRAMPV